MCPKITWFLSLQELGLHPPFPWAWAGFTYLLPMSRVKLKWRWQFQGVSCLVTAGGEGTPGSPLHLHHQDHSSWLWGGDGIPDPHWASTDASLAEVWSVGAPHHSSSCGPHERTTEGWGKAEDGKAVWRRVALITLDAGESPDSVLGLLWPTWQGGEVTAQGGWKLVPTRPLLVGWGLTTVFPVLGEELLLSDRFLPFYFF